MQQYIHFRCPNEPLADTDRMCMHSLGGVSVETLRGYGFDVPFADIRYCKDCHAYYEIKVYGLNKPPEISMIGRDVHINWVQMEEIFPLITVHGRRVKGEK